MLKSIIGGILMAGGLFLLAGFLINAAEVSFAINAGDIAAMLILAVTPAVGGALMIRSHFVNKRKALQKAQQTKYLQQEKEIIRLAQQKQGRLSIPDIVAETSLSSLEAEQMMRTMTEKGYINMQVTDSGVILYEFYEIAARNELEE